jgi:alpha-beta hydrolase superfamily lysophospholipase
VKNAFDGTILSRDPAVAERYLADPLNHHATTTRLGAEALAEQKRATAALDRLSLPTLVYHGGDDRLVPTASSEVFASAPEVTRRTYPGLRHESHNEPEGEAVIADVIAWLRSVLESDHN